MRKGLRYSLSADDKFNGDGATQRARASAAMSVDYSPSKKIRPQCRKFDAKKYFQAFSELNTSLTNISREDDLSHKFLNMTPDRR